MHTYQSLHWSVYCMHTHRQSLHWLDSISFGGCRHQSPATSYRSWQVHRLESPLPPPASCHSKTPSSSSSSESSACGASERESEWAREWPTSCHGWPTVPRLWKLHGGVSQVLWVFAEWSLIRCHVQAGRTWHAAAKGLNLEARMAVEETMVKLRPVCSVWGAVCSIVVV